MEDKGQEKHELKDVSTSWVSTSRYLFYLSIGATVAFMFAMCVALYMHRYQGNPPVEIPSSTLYNPTYK
ncbi:MAG TPA: hypothetical protein VK084_02350 [Chitinophagaceae bacterium]|nr:hypothetical protein [Chitinophagaceae bacterium]